MTKREPLANQETSLDRDYPPQHTIDAAIDPATKKVLVYIQKQDIDTITSIVPFCEGSTDGWYDFGPELDSIEKLLKSRLSDKENNILKRVHTAHVYTATFLGDDDGSED